MEEILFRGFLIGVCFKHNSILALLFSSLLFGLAHKPTDIGSFILYVGIGLGVTGTSVQKVAVVISSKSIKRLFNADYRISKIGKHKIFLEHSCRN